MKGGIAGAQGSIPRLQADPVVLAAVLFSIVIGAGLGLGGSRGFDLVTLGLVCGPLALLFPVASYLWAIGALTAVVLSRVLVEIGAPGLVNHVHFGMALMAAARGLVAPGSWTPTARWLAGVVGAILVVSYLSALVNGSGLLGPGLAWLLFTEPFLIVFGILREPPSPAARRRVGNLLVALLWLQLPFSVWKFREWGFSDAVRGTFLDQGAGAHVMGAMALVSATGAVLGGHVRNRIWRITVIGLAIVLNIMADAKQSLGMFVIAVSAIGIMNSPRNWPRYVIGLAGAVTVINYAAEYHSAMNQYRNLDLIERGLRSKVSVVPLIASQLETPADWVFGAGPGGTISRLALMALPEYQTEGVSAMPFDLEASPITRIIWYHNEIGELSGAGGSSAWSLIASWVGIWGDLGVVGVLLYALAGYVLWRGAATLDRSARNAVRITVALTGLLGFVFSYLEEPGLMLVAGGWIGLLLTGAGRRAEAGGGSDARAPGA